MADPICVEERCFFRSFFVFGHIQRNSTAKWQYRQDNDHKYKIHFKNSSVQIWKQKMFLKIRK